MAIITVSSTAALNSALKVAHDGDTIQLTAGQYDGVVAKNLSFAHGITITSADPAHQAVLTDFALTSDSGITVSNVEMATLGTGSFRFGASNSSNITFDHVSVHGSLDGNTADDSGGIGFAGCTNVTISNSEFQQLSRAMSFSKTTGITVTHNNVHDIATDGLDFAQVSNVKVSGNTFTNFYATNGAHPDAIQFWTTGTTASSHDIVISNNVITEGKGSPMQGIFLSDELGTMPYQNVTISNNLVDGTGYNGIRVIHADNITVSGNTLSTSAGGGNTYILVEKSDHVTSTNNAAIIISYNGSTNVTQTGDHTNTVQADSGNALLSTYLHTYGMDSLYSSLQNVVTSTTTTSSTSTSIGGTSTSTGVGGTSTSTAASTTTTTSSTSSGSQVLDATTANLTLKAGVLNIDGTGNALNNYLTGNAGNNHLYGLGGNDTLDGGGGSDTLAGGAGDDTYIVPNGATVIVENPGEGNDTVIAKGDYTLPANVENLQINTTVLNNWNGTGNELNNKITGNGGNNILDGQAGNDTIDGGAGADVIVGGAGDDRLYGGLGDDSFRFAPHSGHDVIADFGVGHDQIDIYAFKTAGLTPTLHDVGSDLVISFTTGDTITVLGTHIADLTANKVGWII